MAALLTGFQSTFSDVSEAAKKDSDADYVREYYIEIVRLKGWSIFRTGWEPIPGMPITPVAARRDAFLRPHLPGKGQGSWRIYRSNLWTPPLSGVQAA
jgi:hypothetical protein